MCSCTEVNTCFHASAAFLRARARAHTHTHTHTHTQEAKRGLGSSAVFIARNRFATLDKGLGYVQIRNLQNEITKRCNLPCPSTDAIFYAGTGMLLCRSEDKDAQSDSHAALMFRSLGKGDAEAAVPVLGQGV
eukprot:1105596-Pelagomonas_calceolata.AAC.7